MHDSSGDDMGRHAAPELDSPTVVIPAVGASGSPPADGAVDLVAVLRNADRKTLRIAAAGVVALVVAMVLVGLIKALPADSALRSSGSSSTSSSTYSGVYLRGQEYAKSLRDGSGYGSSSIMSECHVHGHGYSGQSAKEFQAGCYSIAMGADNWHRDFG